MCYLNYLLDYALYKTAIQRQGVDDLESQLILLYVLYLAFS